jgi:hypothetical protein
MNDLVETEIGHFPATWHVQPLGALFETQLGKMLSQKARVGNSPKPYLRNKNVQWGRIDVSDMLCMDFNDRETENSGCALAICLSAKVASQGGLRFGRVH